MTKDVHQSFSAKQFLELDNATPVWQSSVSLTLFLGMARDIRCQLAIVSSFSSSKNIYTARTSDELSYTDQPNFVKAKIIEIKNT